MSRRRRHRGGAGGFEPAAVVEERADRAWDLYVRGYSQREIATELKVSQPAVSKILARHADRLAALRQASADRTWAQLTARNESIYRESVRAFERSQRDRTRKLQRQRTNGDGSEGPTTIEMEVEQADGDARFLEQAGRAVDRQAKLWGLTDAAAGSRDAVDTDPAAARDRLARELARLAPAPDPGGVDP